MKEIIKIRGDLCKALILSKSDGKLLLDAFECLLRQCPDCLLVMIGNHGMKIKNKENITETGYLSRDKLLKYMAACDLMLLPLKDTIANNGRWPSKINDYLAAGKPIVATTVGDIKNLFSDYQIGKATADNPEAFALAAFELLKDRELQSEMSKNARRLAEKEFAWPILGNKLENHYNKILNVS